MKTIDTTVLAGYNAGIERDRLRTGIGLIEFERTKDTLKDDLKKLFKEIVDKLNDNEQYFADFAPEYCELLEQVNSDAVAIQTQEKQLKEFKAWEKKLVESDITFC